ncbi:MAG: alpha/beta hydrolase [SAR202 cluster bacterium]|nr:alpha/beta hydrolase [SAR202 cluster bacterium]
MTTKTKDAVERIVQLKDFRARFLEAGQGTPTISIHGVGFTSGAEGWLPSIRAGLASKLHIMALDNAGWGAADRPTFEYSISFFVDFVRELQDTFGYAKTNVIGHSLGGWIAATLAYESPERINKLVLDDIAGMNAEPPAAVANFSMPNKEQVRQQIGNQFRPEDVEEQVEYAWRNVNTPNAEASYRQITHHLHDPAMRSRYHLGRRLPHIKVPTLVCWGEHGNAMFPQSMGRDIAARIPGAKFTVIPGGTHFVPQGKPVEFAAAVNAFLE